jgi:hypothetical protein
LWWLVLVGCGRYADPDASTSSHGQVDSGIRSSQDVVEKERKYFVMGVKVI